MTQILVMAVDRQWKSYGQTSGQIENRQSQVRALAESHEQPAVSVVKMSERSSQRAIEVSEVK